MPEVSVNQINALWINAEADALELMADSYDDRDAWLLAFEDDDDPPPTAPARVIALEPWDEADEGMAA